MTNFFAKRRVMYGKLNDVEAYKSRKEKCDDVMVKKQEYRCKLRQFLVNEAEIKFSLEKYVSILGGHKEYQRLFKSTWSQMLVALQMFRLLRSEKRKQKERIKRFSDQIKVVRCVISHLDMKFKKATKKSILGNHMKEIIFIESVLIPKVSHIERKKAISTVLKAFLAKLFLKVTFNDQLNNFSEQCYLIRRRFETIRQTVHSEVQGLPKRVGPTGGGMCQRADDDQHVPRR